MTIIEISKIVEYDESEFKIMPQYPCQNCLSPFWRIKDELKKRYHRHPNPDGSEDYSHLDCSDIPGAIF